MDLFEQFGITPEMQQIVTVFSLLFTLVYPLVRWGMIPAVRWAFKRRPRSELFQAILKRMESDSATVRGNWLVSDKLMVDGVNDHTPVVKWVSDGDEYTNLDGFLTKLEKRKIFRIASNKVREFKDKEEHKLEERLLAEIQPQASNGPFQFCANGMPYVPDKPAVQVVFTPACSPAVESNLSQQEGMEASQPTQGDQSTVEEWRKLAKDQLEVIQGQRIKIGEYILQIEAKDKEIEKLNRPNCMTDWETIAKQHQTEIDRLNSLLNYRDSRIRDQASAIAEADKTIKNQQDLIDRMKKEMEHIPAVNPIQMDPKELDKLREELKKQSEILVDPYKRLNRVMADVLKEKTQIEDVKELARIMCTTSGHLPDEKEVNAQEIVLREAADRLRKEHGSHYRVVWEKPHGGVYWVPVLKASGPVLNIPKQT